MLSYEIRSPILAAVVQFVITLIVAIIVINVIWGDTLREAVTLGAVFGVLIVIITYVINRFGGD